MLGPYYFGLWGFITMVIEYLKYSTLGIQHSLNVELSTIEKEEEKNKDVISKLIGNSLISTLILSSILTIPAVIIYYNGFGFGAKYNLEQYIFLIVAFIIFNNVSLIYINIYRSYINLPRIIFSELIFGILPFVTIFFFKGENLLLALLFAMLFARVISIAMFAIKFPFPFSLSFNFDLAKKLIYVGFGLLIYNVSYTLVFLSARTIVSIFYNVEEMGYFTLAFTITSATLMGLNAITFVVYPKILYKLRDGQDNEEAISTVLKYSKIYSTVVSLIILFVIMIAPLVFIFIEEYSPIATALNFLLLAQAIYSYSYIYASMSFARKKQYEVAKFSLILLAIIFCIYLVLGYLQIEYKYIALVIILYVTIYSVWQMKFGNFLLDNMQTYTQALQQLFPLKVLIPFIVIFFCNMVDKPIYSGIAFILFISLNFKEIRFTIYELVHMLRKN